MKLTCNYMIPRAKRPQWLLKFVGIHINTFFGDGVPALEIRHRFESIQTILNDMDITVRNSRQKAANHVVCEINRDEMVLYTIKGKPLLILRYE